MRKGVFSYAEFPGLKIDSIGFSSKVETTWFGPGERNCYLIHYILDGAGTYNNLPLKKGQGFLTVPGQHEEFYPDPKQPWTLLWIISSDPGIADFFPYYRYDLETKVFTYDFPDKLAKLKTLLTERNRGIISRAEILELYMGILKNHPSNTIAATQSNAQIYVDFSRNYIHLHYREKLAVSTLTQILGVSQPYLFKIFTAATGCSPKQYIMNYRIKQAKRLLLETNLPITQISQILGFEDVLSFSKCFKRKAGYSPQNYRLAKTTKVSANLNSQKA